MGQLRTGNKRHNRAIVSSVAREKAAKAAPVTAEAAKTDTLAS
ncbi:hypothetical protein Q4F19_20445 [Sphingomonas sp. BIUV-7]|uniref:Uncharacterized protein n=1 Tax=Sphingomonas natans TaxID=3063330 RepID=A0ABT8YEG7_9SPHN|nr:hypothetical protein [Sphingomonas sp. BIUV-7]MDO6416766.1 hypothetical protein [Sphingomonas sp. BIUV-7]